MSIAEPPFPRYVLLTDAPPLKEGGHGCHVLAWNWLEMAGAEIKLVITHRLNPALGLEKIAGDLSAPVAFYPDLSGIRWPRKAAALKSFLEVLIFLTALPRLAARIRESGAERVFAIFGADPWFLIVVYLLSCWCRLPLDIYLVDDLEESARLARQPLVAWLARLLEPKVLRSAQRVFTISPGYAEHLHRKYGAAAQWLPIPVPQLPVAHQPFRPQQPDVRSIAFVGAVNPLYLGALKDVLRAIEAWNSDKNVFQLRLLFLTYSSPAYIEEQLGPSAHVEVRFRAGDEEFQCRLRESWAVVVPYSFAEEVRVMVTTSFPSKLVAAFLVGRPILVYGPSYASLPRYFTENGLHFHANSLPQLKRVLHEIDRNDTIELMQRYEAVIGRLHSPAYLRAILAGCSERKPKMVSSTI